MKRFLSGMLILCFALVPSGAHAGWCFGKVIYFGTDGGGNATVAMDWRNPFGYVKICNINQDWNGISPVTCALWLSVIKSAQLSKVPMWWQYSDNDVPAGASNGPGCVGMAFEPNSPAPLKILLTSP